MALPLRANVGRILVGVVLLALMYAAMLLWLPYHAEQRASARLRSLGCKVDFDYIGPNWIPYGSRQRLKVLERVWQIRVSTKEVPEELLSELDSLTNLTRLFLTDTDLTDDGLKYLRRLTSLKLLLLRSTRISGQGFEHLTGLTQLEELDVRDTPFTDEGLQHLSRLSNLHSLSLSYTAVTDDGLRRLQSHKALRRLTLKHTQVTDAGLPYLAELSNLRRLELDYTPTTAPARDRLRKAIPACEITPSRDALGFLRSTNGGPQNAQTRLVGCVKSSKRTSSRSWIRKRMQNAKVRMEETEER